jgi:hypothetical protein
MRTASEASKAFLKWRVLLIETLSNMSQKFLWLYFHCGKLQNSVHHKAYCKGCVAYHMIQAELLDSLEDLDLAAAILAENSRFEAGADFLKTVISFRIDLNHTQPALLLDQLGERNQYSLHTYSVMERCHHVFMHLLKQQLLPLL